MRATHIYNLKDKPLERSDAVKIIHALVPRKLP